jgi:hypothetical protein
VNDTAANATITLPHASSHTGKVISFQGQSPAHKIILNIQGSDRIFRNCVTCGTGNSDENPLSSYPPPSVTTNPYTLELVSNGTGWLILIEN